MKNVHILAANKSSLLHLKDKSNYYLTLEPNNFIPYSYPQHIYITSDENPEENEWVIRKNGQICKFSYSDSTVHYKTPDNAPFKGKKIILTTDQDLIAGGVQKIDDNFLEWFFKNLSCEFVEIDEKTNKEIQIEIGTWGHDEGLLESELKEWLEKGGNLYKIIIPNEEPKFRFDNVNMEEPTIKEILEKVAQIGEFAEKKYLERLDNFQKVDFKDGVFEGAKWQQEKMYSEEEVLKLFNDWCEFDCDQDSFSGKDDLTFNQWFEKFKKK